MPPRALVSQMLAELLGVLSHPNRVRIVEELRDEERDVNTLQASLGISHSGVSQHLAVMRARRIVVERREGRRVLYRLRNPELARWLVDGLTFVEGDVDDARTMRAAIKTARSIWSD